MNDSNEVDISNEARLYVLNVYSPLIKDRDRKKRTQNFGVMVKDSELTYFGIIRNIIELQYAYGMPVVVFDCAWFNTDPKKKGH
ncbi:hypothetical protein QQ045_011236 [Rhodiola kirilowii]